MSLAEVDHSGRFSPRAQASVGTVVRAVAYVLAMTGGLVLAAITLMTVVSITGLSRFFSWAPQLASFFQTIEGGYYELVQAGTAFAVFAFLPWCQLQRGHVTVDVFVSGMGPKVMAFLALVGNLILTFVTFIIAWRLWLGLLDKQSYQETTFILQFPIWWGYVAALIGAVTFFLVSLFTVWRSLNEVTGFGEPNTSPVVH